MMMPLRHCIFYYHRNTSDRSQSIELKWDLTLRMMWQYWMRNHPFWLIEVEEDLIFTSFIQSHYSMRMMMPLHHCSYHHRSIHNRTQSIEEKWDLTLRMIWYNGKHYHPFWLIEGEVDLLLISFFQLYQSKRMMRPRVRHIHHRNTTDRTQWIGEKWDLTLQMMWYNGKHNHPVWLI